MKQYPNSRIVLPDIHHLKATPSPDYIIRLSRLVLNMDHMYGAYSFPWLKPFFWGGWGGGGVNR